jgi:hypothetical protein
MKLPAFTIIAMLAILSMVGCHRLLHLHKHPPASLPSSAPAPVFERTVGSFRPPPAPVLPVKQGPAPLAYIVEASGPNGTTVRIVEVESGVTLAEGIASRSDIVSVDERAGIRVGRDLLVPGPLASGRTYQIFLDDPSENEFRSERILPGAQPKAR